MEDLTKYENIDYDDGLKDFHWDQPDIKNASFYWVKREDGRYDERVCTAKDLKQFLEGVDDNTVIVFTGDQGETYNTLGLSLMTVEKYEHTKYASCGSVRSRLTPNAKAKHPFVIVVETDYGLPLMSMSMLEIEDYKKANKL